MTAGAALSPPQKKAMLEELRLLDAHEAAQTDPKALINEIRYFDPVTQLWVEFKMFPPDGWKTPLVREDVSYGANLHFEEHDGAEDWLWQSVFIDWLHDPEIHSYLAYKARQLGITLVACAYALWLMLYRPGTNCAAYSYEETEAQKLVQASYDMFTSLPPIMRNEVEVVTPQRGAIPTEWFKVRHKDGRLSTFQGLPATGLHGHGGRITFSIQDELARQKYGRLIYEAITPAVLSRGGKWLGISTAFGVSNPETGEGNFFHHLYDTRKDRGISYTFLPWNSEPTRDEKWYKDVAMKLPTAERNRQYPLNEADGFLLSGLNYFDPEVLEHYRDNVASPKITGSFYPTGYRRARLNPSSEGYIQIYERPVKDGSYVISVDTSTGRAADYTSADVLDLSSGALVAHLHAKIETPRAAFQVHYLGKLYNTAKIAVERGGGYGEALIIALRDGNNQLPIYPNLYRHVSKTKGNQPIAKEYGFPMTPKSRPAALESLKYALFQRKLPWISMDHLYELGTFVHKDTSPTPRAEDGCNDDCVLSLAMGWYIYEQSGETPGRELKRQKRKPREYRPGPVRAGG